MFKHTYEVNYLVFDRRGKRTGHGHIKFYCKKHELIYLLDKKVLVGDLMNCSTVITCIIKIANFVNLT